MMMMVIVVAASEEFKSTVQSHSPRTTLVQPTNHVQVIVRGCVYLRRTRVILCAESV